MASSCSSPSITFTKAIHMELLITFLIIICFWDISHCHGMPKQMVINFPLLTQKIGTNRTIMVDTNGNGQFKSVQAAIDSIPEGNSQWVIIHVERGVYREKVHVPENKPYIFIRGSGHGKTAIAWEERSQGNKESATFQVEAPNFIAFGISFKNEAPLGVASNSQNQSVAAFVGADKVAFFHCAFHGIHNTLFDHKGRHYYDSCYIRGSIDFIFGRGQSLFHNCEIFVTQDRRADILGSITAHHRESPDENSGFVFHKGKIYGVGDGVHLGRAKGAHSRVIFANTYISKTIVPQGWTNWSYSGSTDNIYHAEYRCHGPGSDTKKRAPWSKQLKDEEVAPFLSVDFIDGKQWLPV